jgi:hypothetical protein
MDSSDSEGLGLSLLVYMAAITSALALFALPVYLAAQPTVFANPPLVRGNLNGPVIGYRGPTGVSLALLKKQTIVDPAMIAALNAKVAKSAQTKKASHRTAQRSKATSLAELQTERQRRPFFLFSLF